MSLMDSVAGPLHWARKRLDVVRKSCEEALVLADQNGGHRVRELQHLLEGVSLSLRQHADEQLQNVQIRLDKLNRLLAQEAVPDERKSQVGRLALDQKAASAAARSGRALKGATARVQSIRPTTKPGKAGAAKPPRTENAATKKSR
ncbi:hypothetical protein [Marinobacter sp. V034]|uniref:hypothetical protein n=1 Tax=Marinobacter sp. V034 TaxID=3459610 RepID=UPI004043BADD